MTNLRFYTNYQVMKINFENGRATSVQVQNNFKETVTLAARKGVILAAGAIFTPQLLQVSGIGDPALLRDLGVPEVVSNPDVGQNFVDRNILNFGAPAEAVFRLLAGQSNMLPLAFQVCGRRKEARSMSDTQWPQTPARRSLSRPKAAWERRKAIGTLKSNVLIVRHGRELCIPVSLGKSGELLCDCFSGSGTPRPAY